MDKLINSVRRACTVNCMPAHMGPLWLSQVLMNDRLLLSLYLTLQNSRHRQVKASINYPGNRTKVNIRIWVLIVELQ